MGYLVGSDDFHWLVAVNDPDSLEYLLELVHKASAPRIRIAPQPDLHTETKTFQNFVSQIGQGFWNFCNKNYLGKHVPAEETASRQEQTCHS